MRALYHACGKGLSVANRSVFEGSPFSPQLVSEGNGELALGAATRHPAPFQRLNVYPRCPRDAEVVKQGPE